MSERFQPSTPVRFHPSAKSLGSNQARSREEKGIGACLRTWSCLRACRNRVGISDNLVRGFQTEGDFPTSGIVDEGLTVAMKAAGLSLSLGGGAAETNAVDLTCAALAQ